MKGNHAGQQELKLRVSPPIQTCLATNQAKSSTSEPVSNFRLNRFLYRGGLIGKFQPNKFLKSRFLASCGVLLYLHSRQDWKEEELAQLVSGRKSTSTAQFSTILYQFTFIHMEKVHCDDTRKNQHSKVHFQLELIRTR